MAPKLVDILIKIFAYAFTPYSKWHIVVQAYHMMQQFILYEFGRNARNTGEAMLQAAHQELFTTTTIAFIGVVIMHICYGEKMRKMMRKSSILPMEDDAKWIKWGRRVILLTRH